MKVNESEYKARDQLNREKAALTPEEQTYFKAHTPTAPVVLSPEHKEAAKKDWAKTLGKDDKVVVAKTTGAAPPAPRSHMDGGLKAGLVVAGILVVMFIIGSVMMATGHGYCTNAVTGAVDLANRTCH